MSVLEVGNVSRHFGSLVAVRDVSLTVEQGELRAIIGPNGAGKTTFFNLISGFLPAYLGQRSPSTARTSPRFPRTRVRRGIARTFQITEIFPELTVCENVRIAVDAACGYRLRPWISRAERERARGSKDARLIGLAAKADRLVGELAYGDQRAAEIMMALALRPRLLLLDEPTAGMGDRKPTKSRSSSAACITTRSSRSC